MNKFLFWIFNYLTLCAVAPGDGGLDDRGDDFAPDGTDDEEDAKSAPKDEPKAEADDADEEDDEDEAKPDPKAKKDGRIPASRHKAILEREREQRKEVERRLAQYEQGQKVADVNKTLTAAETTLTAMEQEYGQLLADGKISEATAKMSEIRRAEREIIQGKAQMDMAVVEARAVETVRYSTTLERVESSFPELNEDHDDYDKSKAAEVIDLKESFQARGYTPSVALQRAVKYVMGEPKTRAQETAVETKARVDETEVKAEVKSTLRKENQVKKNIDAALKTPASTAKIGMDSDKAGGSIDAKSVIKMSHADFSKLDDATLARMRGDELV